MAKDDDKKKPAGKDAPADKAKKPTAKKPAAKKAAAKPAAAKAAASAQAGAEQEDTGPARLLKHYREIIVPALMEEFKFDSTMQVPRIKKVTLNVGLGRAVANPNIVPIVVEELGEIAGQKAVATKSKLSIANFKLREGLAIGCMVTLRRRRMWEFLDRLLNVAMPRIRDFKGVSEKAFDGAGNFNCGIGEQTIFPEIKYEKVQEVHGMNISITTTARTDAEGKALLKHLGMPFRR